MELNAQQIEEILPHRYPFLLVDRITECEPGQKAAGIKCVSVNEPYFCGHFPGHPVMPGVLIIEALAQVGAVALLTLEEFRGKIALFGGIKNARFRRPVQPGDVLRLECELIRRHGPWARSRPFGTVPSVPRGANNMAGKSWRSEWLSAIAWYDSLYTHFRTGKEVSGVLETAFSEVYTKFKLHFYRKVFERWESREATLTTVETFCMEIIYALDRPTVNEFASFVQISPPNAAYKVNSLIRKGYLKKVQSQEDKREYRLVPTQKYCDYYNISYHYLHTVMERIDRRFSPEEQQALESMLNIVSRELMPELPPVREEGPATTDPEV